MTHIAERARPRVALAALAALTLVAAPAAAQSTRLQVAPGSRIVIQGTSNVHKWDCNTARFTGTADVPAGVATEVGKAASAMEVTIPVASLDCGHAGMTKNLRNAMHASRYPTILFRMTSYATTPVRNGGAWEARLGGRLTINGVEKPVQVKATVVPDGKGGARAEGSVDLRTTDYGVQPVKAVMGTIRTGDKVTIVITLVAEPATAARR